MKLSDIFKNANPKYEKYLVTCPVCCNKTLEPGEYVEHWKVTPDTCCICGYLEGNGTAEYPGNYEFVEKCWQLQVAPYQELDLDINTGEFNK